MEKDSFDLFPTIPPLSASELFNSGSKDQDWETLLHPNVFLDINSLISGMDENKKWRQLV